MFYLNDEQIKEIIFMYGGSVDIIKYFENKINLIGVVENEEDFYEIIASIMSQKFSIELNLKQYDNNQDKDFVFMSDDEIIELELNRRYQNFEYSSPKIKRKMLNFANQKNRHN